MATEKHLRLTGSSEISWKDAVNQTIAEAAKTIDYLTKVTILEQTAKISGKKMVEYYVELDLCFTIDSDRD